MLNGIPSSKKPSSSSETAKPNPNASRTGARKTATRRRHWRRDVSRPDRQEVSAGGVVYRRRNGAVEVFFIKDSYGRWTFPKGHQELGETLAETAVREIGEETGLVNLRYIAPVGKKILRFRREVGVIHKSVHYFLFEAPADAKERFRTREEVGEGHELVQEGKWVPMRQAFAVSSYKNSDGLLANAFRIIGATQRPEREKLQPAVLPPRVDGSGRPTQPPTWRRRRWKPRSSGPKPGGNAPRVTF